MEDKISEQRFAKITMVFGKYISSTDFIYERNMLKTQSGKYKRLMTSINMLLHQFEHCCYVSTNSLTFLVKYETTNSMLRHFPVMKALKEAYIQDWNPYSKKMISYISSKILRKEVERLQKQQHFLGGEGTFFIGIISGKLTNIFFDKIIIEYYKIYYFYL